MKMDQKIHSMVVLSELSSLFVKISIKLLLRNLLNDMMHAKWLCHALTQEISRTSKIRYTLVKFSFITKKHKEAVPNVEFTVWQNQRYPASTTHILEKFSNFCSKIEIFVAFHIYFASNITLVLRVMISNKFYYYVQTAKVNSKDVSC